MRLLILSDLHLEHATFDVPQDVEYDVAVLAGDIHSPGTKAVDWAQRPSTFGGKAVVFVPGNHEWYRTCMQTESAAMRDAAQGSNVHVLDRNAVVIDGTRFLGTTLWTDFHLPVQRADGTDEVNVTRALIEAQQGLNDFRCIDVAYKYAPVRQDQLPRARRRPLTAEDTLARHHIDRDWLRREFGEPHAGPLVVVTHHAPTRKSVAPRYARNWLSPAFVSDLPLDAFMGPASLWVHGHTHTSFRYMHGLCTVVSNPRGYPTRRGFENTEFDSRLVVDLDDLATCSRLRSAKE